MHHRASQRWRKAEGGMIVYLYVCVCMNNTPTPLQTEKGVLMITSLANFRSDLNIVHIPGGNVLDVRDDLFVNINLLRMGCSGRSGLNLDKPR